MKPRYYCLGMALALLALGLTVGAAAQNRAKNVPSKIPQGVTASPSGNEFTLNFKDADITALIATVSEITGRNFVVDPRVKGQITVLSSHPMSPDELYETFLSVLDVHGYSAIRAGQVTKIVPQVNAKQEGEFGTNGGLTHEDIVTRVLQVKNVPADQLVPILRPLVPQYGHLAAYPASNILIISDRKANVQRLARIVSRIDKQGNRRVETITLKNANATDVVQTLNALKAGAGKTAPATADFTAIADERTNSVVLAGDPQSRLRLRAIIADLDTPVAQSGGTQVVYLNYADAKNLAPVLQSYSENKNKSSRATKGAGRAPGTGELSVIADPGANALVINAPADQMREIHKIINQLDIRRAQVLVEAIIAEVTIQRSRQLGIDIAALNKNTGAAASILNSNTLQVIPQLASTGTPLGLIQQGLNLAVGNVNSNGRGFAVLLHALSGSTDTNVLSTPSLLTRDNEEAKIEVGQEVPFVTGSFSNTGTTSNGTVNPFTTVQRKDVGLSLTITPQINTGDTIQLDIKQEISSIASSAQNAVDLITNKRTLSTSVEVDNGQILVLGGLIDDDLEETNQRVPILSDIPLLGALFRFQDTTRKKRNLLNFIRPTILRGKGAANYYTRKKYNYIRALQKAQHGSRIPLFPHSQRPLLPPIERYEHGPVLPKKHNRPGAGAVSEPAGKGTQ